MNDLLKILEGNARYSDKELSSMLGVSEDEIRAQMAQLEKDGIICGYKAMIDWDKVSDDRVTALIELKVTPQHDAGFDEIAKTIMNMSEVESIYLMSGGFDFSVIVRGRTFKEVALFVANRLAPMQNIVSTATHFVLRRYKDNGVAFFDTPKDDRGPVWF